MQQQPCAASSQVKPSPLFDQILQAYRAHDFDPRKSLQGHFVLSDGFWCKRDWGESLKVVIPEDAKLQENILHELHDSHVHAHKEQRGTTKQVARHFWWPGITSYVKLYIKICHACQIMKAGNRKPAGLLRCLQIPFSSAMWHTSMMWGRKTTSLRSTRSKQPEGILGLGHRAHEWRRI